ncbi:hypothetical protein VIH_002368 [Vibrio cholerae CT 5369-93]|nr:hypothetical protein VIH_002368 [Vibrio cholerae CT 5369-93]
MHKLAFAFFLDADLVERVESSVVSKLLKTIKPRCRRFSMLLDAQLGKFGFTKSCIVAEIALSLSEIR